MIETIFGITSIFVLVTIAVFQRIFWDHTGYIVIGNLKLRALHLVTLTPFLIITILWIWMDPASLTADLNESKTTILPGWISAALLAVLILTILTNKLFVRYAGWIYEKLQIEETHTYMLQTQRSNSGPSDLKMLAVHSFNSAVRDFWGWPLVFASVAFLFQDTFLPAINTMYSLPKLLTLGTFQMITDSGHPMLAFGFLLCNMLFAGYQIKESVLGPYMFKRMPIFQLTIAHAIISWYTGWLFIYCLGVWVFYPLALLFMFKITFDLRGKLSYEFSEKMLQHHMRKFHSGASNENPDQQLLLT